MRIIAPMMILIMMASLFVGCTEGTSDGNNESENIEPENIEPENNLIAQISVDPMGIVQVGQEITFVSQGTTREPNGNQPLSHSWIFGDGNNVTLTDSSFTTTHSYSQEGEYIMQLKVSNGTHEDTVSTTISIINLPDYIKKPQAVISTQKENNCYGESPPSGDFIYVWICDENKNLDDKSINISRTSVILDGTNSSHGCEDGSDCTNNNNSLVKYIWDLDPFFDSDSDGIPNNDNDMEGDLVILEDMAAGYWRIRLIVEDSYGQRSFHDSRIYVNQRAIWDFDIISPTSYSWELNISAYNGSNGFPRFIQSTLIHQQQYDERGVEVELILRYQMSNSKYYGEHSTKNAECIDGEYRLSIPLSGSDLSNNDQGILNITMEHDEFADSGHENEISTKVDFFIEIIYR